MMRISPVGFLFETEKEVLWHATPATKPSYNSIEAINSATKIALLIFYLRKGISMEEAFEKIHLSYEYKPFKKFNSTCKDTLENCLYALYTSKYFEDALRIILSMGGDTDTNACIVGALAEANMHLVRTI